MNYNQIQLIINQAWELPDELKQCLDNFWCDPLHLSFSEMLHVYDGLVNANDDVSVILQSGSNMKNFLKRFNIYCTDLNAAFNLFREYIRQRRLPMILNWYAYYGMLYTKCRGEADTSIWFEIQRETIVNYYYSAMLKTIDALGWSKVMVDEKITETHGQISFTGTPIKRVPVKITVDVPSVVFNMWCMPCRCAVSVGENGGVIEIHGASASRTAVKEVYESIFYLSKKQ